MWTDVHRRLALKWTQLRSRRDALTRKRDPNTRTQEVLNERL
jgi:hypothetical protein